MKATLVSAIGVFQLLISVPLFAAQGTAAQCDSGSIKIMQYNVENLFDATHDDKKDDYEFLPANSPEKEHCAGTSLKSVCRMTDWTDEKLALKISQLTKVILSQGSLPDIMVIEEVENDNVVSMLAKSLGFESYVMTDSPDQRGIDVAILYNQSQIQFLEKVEQHVSIGFATRNLIVANFRMPGGEILGVFGNHWPSQLHPDDQARLEVAQQLKTFVESQGQKYGDAYHVILAGDFNTTAENKPTPIDQVILDKGWTRDFASVRELYQAAGGTDFPGGTFYYSKDKQWDEFDLFFASGNLHDGVGLDVIPESYHLNKPDFASKTVDGIQVPMAYNVKATSEADAGYSDHFAIIMNIKTR